MPQITNEQIADYRDSIHRPGKFEGESVLTPYLYDRAMNGDGEMLGDEPVFTLFILDAGEQQTFDAEPVALMWESDEGFAYSAEFTTEAEARHAIAGAE